MEMSNKSGGSKPPPPRAVQNHNSQVTNANKGTSGVNRPYSVAQGHRGTQIAQNKGGRK